MKKRIEEKPSRRRRSRHRQTHKKTSQIQNSGFTDKV